MRTFRSLALTLVALPAVALFAAACGDVEEAEFDAAEEEAEARISYDYRCDAQVGRNNPEAFSATVALRGTKLTITKAGAAGQTGSYNASYTPRSARNANMVQYRGFNSGALQITTVMVERSLRSGGATLRGGGKGGKLRAEYSNSGYWSIDFSCKAATGGGSSGGGTSSGVKTVEGVSFTAAQAAQTVAAANRATAAQLRTAKITGQSQASLLAGRPFDSVESVAGAPSVGKVTLERLRGMNFAAGTPTPTPTPSGGLTAAQQRAITAAHDLIAGVTDYSVLEGRDPDSEPPGISRVEAMGGFSNAWIHDAGQVMEELIIVIGRVDDRVYFDVFFEGSWIDHGFAQDGDHNQLFWAGQSAAGLSDTDRTMCRCENGSSMWVCTGIDGSKRDSDTMICD